MNSETDVDGNRCFTLNKLTNDCERKCLVRL